jgi:DNA modification methylase
MQIEPNTFICADSIEVLREIPDKAFDLCLTDPPYGIGWDRENLSMNTGLRVDGSFRKIKTWNNPKPKNYTTKEWDQERPDDFSQIFRTSKKNIIWGGNYFNFPVSGGWIVWDKEVVMPSLSKCELAWTNCNEHVEIFRYLWAGYAKKVPEERFHPTQKPVSLFVWCLLNYSKPGDLIIDPFCGSGTTALACHKTGRKFLCIDKDEEYIKIAQQRYSDLIAQQDLFGQNEDGAQNTMEAGEQQATRKVMPKTEGNKVS